MNPKMSETVNGGFARLCSDNKCKAKPMVNFFVASHSHYGIVYESTVGCLMNLLSMGYDDSANPLP